MTYKEYMTQPLYLRRRIEHKIEDVRLKESVCMNTTAPMGERTQSSPTNATELSYVRYIDAKNELDVLMDKLGAIQDEVRDFLYGNLSPEEADILEWRYIDGKSQQEISQIVGITYDAMRAKASRAEKKLKKVYNSSQMSQNVTDSHTL